MATLENAISIAYYTQGGQLDRNGQAYLLQVFRVMQASSTKVEKIIGVLHDVLEKSFLTLDNLHQACFSEEVLAAADCLTKHSGKKMTMPISNVSKATRWR